MILKPQDVVLVLKLLSIGERPWTYAQLAAELDFSTSQLYAAVQRALSSQLAARIGERIVPNTRNLREFLVHGLKYVFVPERGEMTRGLPTGYSAPSMQGFFSADEEPPPVWPHPKGNVRGMAFSPLYKIAPSAAKKDSKLYELLALVDAIRGGRARERDIAIKQLDKRLNEYAPAI
jgi:hypothetical protein